MTLSFEITEQEYREAMTVIRRQKGGNWYKPLTYAGIIGGGIGGAFSLGGGMHMLFLMSPLLLLSLFILVYPWLNVHNAFDEGWKAYQSWAGTVTWEFTDEAAVFQCDGVLIRYEWRAFMRFAETRHLFLLYRAKDHPLLISKRARPDASGLEALRTFLQRKVPGRALGFPVTIARS